MWFPIMQLVDCVQSCDHSLLVQVQPLNNKVGVSVVILVPINPVNAVYEVSVWLFLVDIIVPNTRFTVMPSMIVLTGCVTVMFIVVFSCVSTTRI